MAWRSGGTTNTELVDNLVRNGLITSSAVEHGFRRVDRMHFVPEECENEAYEDCPIKKGCVHISAPHIYCTILEALDLKPGTSLSFLNIGSGSGYLTCIASEILGPKSLYYGVEMNENTLNHCKCSVNKWRTESPAVHNDKVYMNFIHGNGLNIESRSSFDRIYVGAAISTAQMKKIRKLLSPKGVLVAPVQDDLVKIVRIRTRSTTLENQDEEEDEEALDEEDHNFTTQIISGVTFAPLVFKPEVRTVIPDMIWDISSHLLYPESFKKATKAILLCQNSRINQPVETKIEKYQNVAATLPTEAWLHIFSFTSRRWFEQDEDEDDLEILERRLKKEQRILKHTRLALSTATTQNILLQHRNDKYLELVRRFYHQMQSIVDQNPNETLHATEALMNESRELLFPTETDFSFSESYDVMENSDYEDEDIMEHTDGGGLVSERPLLSTRDGGSDENTRQIRTVSISSAADT